MAWRLSRYPLAHGETLDAVCAERGVDKSQLYYYCNTLGLSLSEALDKAAANKALRQSRRELRATALANGIPPNVLNSRIWRGWDPERASTQPVQIRSASPPIVHKSIAARCRAIGIKEGRVYYRMRKYRVGVDQAIRDTLALEDRRDTQDRWKQVATANGISPQVFRTRVSRGQSYERAATTPQRQPRERVKPERGPVIKWLGAALLDRS